MGRYDVSADGESFFLRESVEEGREPVIRVVQNWFSEFRDRLSAGPADTEPRAQATGPLPSTRLGVQPPN